MTDKVKAETAMTVVPEHAPSTTHFFLKRPITEWCYCGYVDAAPHWTKDDETRTLCALSRNCPTGCGRTLLILGDPNYHYWPWHYHLRFWWKRSVYQLQRTLSPKGHP